MVAFPIKMFNNLMIKVMLTYSSYPVPENDPLIFMLQLLYYFKKKELSYKCWWYINGSELSQCNGIALKIF